MDYGWVYGFRPQTNALTYSNTIYDYYGAAKLRQLDLDISEAFPKTRSEVEGLPRGVSIASARKAYLKDDLQSRGIYWFKHRTL